MADPLRYFRIEARELLTQLQTGVLELEREGADSARAQRLLRVAHTLKGAARVVKELGLANLAHRFEDLLVPFRDSPQSLGAAEVQALLAVVDAIAEGIEGLTRPPAPAPKAALSPTPEASPTTQREQVEGLMNGVGELGLHLGQLRRLLPELGESRRLAEQLTERASAHHFAGATTSHVGPWRVLSEELVERLQRLEREVTTTVERAARELAQTRDKVEQLRLATAGTIFAALERTTRDAAKSLGKEARFEGRGGDVRLDAEVLSAVQRALVQAVRNAVAHGIEPGPERVQRGKELTGQVTVAVERRGRRVAFCCSDDGSGVNLRQVRLEAERLGRLQRGAGSDDEVLELLLRGGISTSPQVSEVSGRGVGLDLIREALESVGGHVSLANRPTAGTTLTLSVPASLTAVDALVVEAGGRAHCLPLGAVIRAVRVRSEDVARGPEGASLPVGDEVLPFAPLPRLLEQREALTERAAWSVVVLHHEGKRFAVGVDRLLGSESLVARSLPEGAEIEPTVSGVSLDADGQPRLVLDPEGLLAALHHLPAAPVAPKKRSNVILVIDDSLTTRMLEQSILESAGYEVELATSAEEGLEKALARRYDLFLVDVEMPGMDGFSFVERTRADPRLAVTPAVLVTSRVSNEDLARGAAVGAAGHIAKGEFDQVDFLNRIGRLMR
jgi:two-component system, chemotaxis family, sensor kinase CheA